MAKYKILSVRATAALSRKVADGKQLTQVQAETLLDSVDGLREIIEHHHAQRGNDRCWENDANLYRSAGLDVGDPGDPPIEEHFRKCGEYRHKVYGRMDPATALLKAMAGADCEIGHDGYTNCAQATERSSYPREKWCWPCEAKAVRP